MHVTGSVFSVGGRSEKAKCNRLRVTIMSKRLAKCGAALLGLSVVFLWTGLPAWILVSLVIAGLLDVYLVLRKLPTISNWLHDLYPQYIDYPIMGGLLACTWYLQGPEMFACVLVGAIIGHILWHE